MASDSLVAPNPGYWSPTYWLGYTAIHMALLPGDGQTWHSQVVSWEQQPGDGAPDLVASARSASTPSFLGASWGWNPPLADSLVFYYPTFHRTNDLAPGGNILCAGQADLPDGRLFVMGGHVGNDTGIRDSRAYDGPTNTWFRFADMNRRRWYGSVTTLPDDRMLATSGSAYHRVQVIGGLGPAEANPSDAAIHRFALADSIVWDSDDSPDPPLAAISAREGHTLTDDGPLTTFVVFGGRGADGAPRNDVQLLYEVTRPRAPDDGYYTVDLAPLDPPPLPRTRHAAAALADGSVIVFGGLGEVNGRDTVFDDVWRLYPAATCCSWHWTQLAPSGAGPGPRWGHAMIADVQHGRVLVYGGAAAPGDSARDDAVWALTFPPDDPDHPAWSQLVPGGAGGPPPRVGHSWCVGKAGNAFTDSGTVQRAFLFGGATAEDAPDTYLADTWVLTIDPGGDAAWSASPASDAPAPRVRHGAILDPATGRLIVHGGRLADGSRAGDVWALPLDGGAWSLAATDGPAREGEALVREPLPLFVREPEVYDTRTDSWHLMTTAPLLQQWYPFMFPMPGGQVFAAGPDSVSYVLDLENETWRPYPASENSHFVGGNAVMYRPGHVMKCGSRDTEPVGTPSNGTTATIDLLPGAPDSLWVRSANDMLPRVTHNLVILPSGEVLALGGCATIADDENVDPVFQPELWNPDAAGGLGEWYGGTGATKLAADTLVRCYHSTAVLLPDGSVMTAGGNAAGVPQTFARVYFPPYLYNADGTPRVRPTITSAPRWCLYGVTIGVGTPDAANIDHVCLIRPGAATHGFDENQRYVPISFTVGTGVLHAQLPADSSLAPPGEYLLFLVDRAGTPSIARWVRLRSYSSQLDVPGSPAAEGLWLSPPAPNPAHGATTLRFTLPAPGLVRLELFDASGRRVRTLASGWRPAGTYTAGWDGRTRAGAPVSPGVYFCRLAAGGIVTERRVALVR